MKYFYIYFLLIFCFSFSYSQSGFQDHFVDGEFSVNSMSDMIAVDIDGDGDLDAVTAGSISGAAIRWFKNIDGFGNYEIEQVITSSANGAQAIVAADIDNDGDVDLISASRFDNKIAWYENLNGLGDFGVQQIISETAIDARDVYAADFNGDGNIDIVSASYDDDKIAWYKNLDGLGNFGTEQVITTLANGANSVFAIDIDNDTDIDVLSTNYVGGKVAWYENMDGLGNFSDQQVIMDYFTTTSVYAADIDNDGDIDVASASYIDEEISWNENLDGLGSFGPKQVIDTNIGRPLAIYINDIDNNGSMDVLVATEDDNSVAWYSNTDSQGNFGSQQIINSVADGANSVYTGDIDGDGDLDVISTSFYEKKGVWYENIDGQGNFGIDQVIIWGPRKPVSTAIADFNNDGNLDIVSASEIDNKVAWNEQNDSSGLFKTEKLIAVDVFNVQCVYGADIDNDGNIDVVSASSDDNKIAWYRNLDGLGNFGVSQIISNAAIAVQSLVVVDIDGDSDLDIASANIGENKIAWYENLDGLGDFSIEKIITSTMIGVEVVNAADIDNDGDMDIVSGSNNTNNNKIVWFENLDALGNFGSEQIVSTGANGIRSIYVQDIDNDSDIDLVSASFNDDKIAWYQNLDGLGAFGIEQVISINANGAESVVAVDLDNDGDFDIASASSFDDKVVWYPNLDGLGNYGTEQLVSEVVGANSINFADINADGFMDLVSTSGGNYDILWHENLDTFNNIVYGNIYYDLDNNGCDNNDPSAFGLLISATNGSETFSTFSNSEGVYQLLLNEGEYNVSITSQLPNYYGSNPSSYTIDFVGMDNTEFADFCILPTATINDLYIVVYPLDEPRPGFNTRYHLVYGNAGTTELSGQIDFEFDDTKIEFISASEALSQQFINLLRFDFADLSPFEARVIDLEFNVFAPPTTNINDIIESKATINPITGDLIPASNEFELIQVVFGSYDPNDIAVLEGDEIFIEDADKYLHYLIRFQNTGTASAINVKVDHILDDKLDWSTMQIESLSHSGRVEITDQTDVSFVFDNINLPDSTNDEPNSHGYIAFKIKPKSDVQVSDIISGVADIFFDFNPPITTNTVNTQIVEPLSVDEFNTQSIQLFPNPAKDKLEITSNQVIDKLIIIDINGRVLDSIEFSNTDYSMDVSSLTKGVYFLEIQSGNSKSTKKFIKN